MGEVYHCNTVLKCLMGVEKRANLERLLRSAWERQHHPVVPKPKSIKPLRRPRPLDYIIVRMGVPLGLVVSGVSLIAANLFWVGVVVLYIGLLLLAWDLDYEAFFLGWPRSVRIIMGIVYLLAILIASQRWVFRPAPFETMATSRISAYGKGSNINGISWRPEYSELQFYIKNPSAFDYDNFDAEISTNLVMSGLRPLRILSNCNIAGTHQDTTIHWQHMVGGVPVGPADDPNFDYKVIPIDKNGKALLPPSGGDWSYRIRCDKIPAETQFDFFAALEVFNQTTPETQIGATVFGDPQAASWITIKAKFQTSGRDRVETVFQCAMYSYCDTSGASRK
jgi:hypothetical protein